ncbi:MAG: preprotein translocase subunit SecA [Candidatus Pacebacteria bacterium]|nr:preprotein translocase subunit SecA [Candidatus Paceibacterota bacterium]
MFSLNKLFTANSPLLAEAKKVVEKVSALEASMHERSDDSLAGITKEFKARLEQGATLDELLPEAFAAVREASVRTLGQRHFDVQIIGGYVLHNRSIAEMRTGEGKTLVATLPAYLNALEGKGVHIVTVNDYLARRDAVWMGQIYNALGLSVGVINHDSSFLYDQKHVSPAEDAELDTARDELGSFKVVHEFLRPTSRPEAYTADITYGTNNEYGFDYLRDNLEYDKVNLRQHHHHYAIVDEVDSILIDEARTPLIISGPSKEPEDLYMIFAKVVPSLKEGDDYTVDEKLRTVIMTDAGIEKIEKKLGIENIYAEGGIKYAHHLEVAVKAFAVFIKDKDYVVKDGKVVIVDEFTGRLQAGRRWSDGLHQAIEAKEGVLIEKESQTYASITFQNYFRMYKKVAGMTGTGATSEEEFRSVYNLDVVVIPTNKPINRVDHTDLIFQTEAGKFKAIVRTVKEKHEKGQPVLIGTTSIEVNERLAAELRAAGVPHEMLNAKNHEREGEIIAQAGKKAGVTVATNMAGRGVDVKLGGNPATDEAYVDVKSLDGLFVIGTERHDARRIDNQLRGRAGRQGDPGETQFFVSLEDKLMRVFASDMVKSMMGRLGISEDEPIKSKMVSRALESAQEKIEGVNFDSRKHVLGFDDVLNHQRAIIYSRRRSALLGTGEELIEAVREHLESVGIDASIIDTKKSALDPLQFELALRRLLLQAYDLFWIEHLDSMEHLRGSVNLRSYGGRDPFIEYRREGLRMFRDLETSLSSSIADAVSHLGDAPITSSQTIVIPSFGVEKLGRNDKVTITDGVETKEMKFKKAEEYLTKGWKILEK